MHCGSNHWQQPRRRVRVQQNSHPVLERFCNAEAAANVPAIEVRGKASLGVVCHGNCLLFRRETNQWRERTKRLLLHHLQTVPSGLYKPLYAVTVGPRCVLLAHQGVSRHIGENSWRKKVDADLWQPLAADTNLPVQNKPNQSVDQVTERNTMWCRDPSQDFKHHCTRFTDYLCSLGDGIFTMRADLVYAGHIDLRKPTDLETTGVAAAPHTYLTCKLHPRAGLDNGQFKQCMHGSGGALWPYQWTNHAAWVGTGPDCHLFDFGRELGGKLLVYCLVDEDAIGTHAGLTRVAELAADQAVYRRIQVSVFKDDKRCVAS